jgi:hypothetical protein
VPNAYPVPSSSRERATEGVRHILSIPCHFDQSVSGVEKSLPAGQRQGSGEECTPTYFFVALKNDVGVNAAKAARFLVVPKARSALLHCVPLEMARNKVL